MADQKTSRKGSAPCGLYLVLPNGWMEPEFLKNLRDLFRAINASDYEKNNHVIEFRASEGAIYSSEQIEIISAMSALTKSQGVNFIVGNDVALAQKCGADGVLVDNIEQVEAARAALGDDLIVGVRCGASRRKSEQALEAGADYISFHDVMGTAINPALIQWWHYKSPKPCLVEGRYTNDDCDFYVLAGADFIDAGSYVWNHPEGVMKGVVNMTYAIDLALYGDKKEMMQ